MEIHRELFTRGGLYRYEGWEDIIREGEQDILFACTEIEKRGKGFIPREHDILNALELPPDDVRVVIIGEGPYSTSPTGYSFDSNIGVRASQRNIFKELEKTVPGFVTPPHGCLLSWHDQGVMLLNKDLTVAEGQDRAHKGLWSGFLSRILKRLTSSPRKIIYVLWGGEAQKVKEMLRDDALILEAAHPSPMNSRGGFLGCGHFVKINQHFSKQKEETIDWKIPRDPNDRPYRKIKPVPQRIELEDSTEENPLTKERDQNTSMIT